VSFRANSLIETVFKKGNSLFVFASFWDKPNQTEILYLREFDLETRQFTAEPKVVLESKNEIDIR